MMNEKEVFASRVVDQRGPLYEEKSYVNRGRFNRRYREAIKRAVEEQLEGKGFSGITGEGHLVVEIDPMEIPSLEHEPGSAPKEHIIPGNNYFVKGDRIPKGNGSGDGDGSGNDPGDGSNKRGGRGKGQGKVRLPITEEEWLGLVFEDLELPDMDLKKLIMSSDQLHLEQQGFSSAGPAHLLDLKRTLLRSDGRMSVIEQQIEDDIEDEKRKLRQQEALVAEEEKEGRSGSSAWIVAKALVAEHKRRIAEFEKELGAVPEFEKIDLRYRHHERVPVPISEAAVFFHLDVSGSMDENAKRLALLLFRLKYRFLKKMYQRVHLVPLHYTSEAYECQSVEEFFTASGTGGTVYSSCLELHKKIQEERFPADRYNIYISHASDGENSMEDRGAAMQLLMESVLPRTQYYVYAQVGSHSEQSEFWGMFRRLRKRHAQVASTILSQPGDIVPAFRALFKKKGVKVK